MYFARGYRCRFKGLKKQKSLPKKAVSLFRIHLPKMELTPDNASLRTTEGQLRLSLISNIFFTPHFLLSAPCFLNLILKTILYQNPHRRIYFPIGNKTCFLFVLSCKEAMCPARYEGYGLYSIEARICTLFLYLPVHDLLFAVCSFCRFSRDHVRYRLLILYAVLRKSHLLTFSLDCTSLSFVSTL